MAFDAAVLSSGKGFHGELDEAVLAEQPLPAFRAVAGRIDTTRREAGDASDAVARWAGGVRAVARARYPQGGRERVVFDAVGEALREAVRGGAAEGAVGGTAGVIDDVRAGRLEARGVGFDYQPVQEREDFVEACIAVQVGVVEEPEAAVAIADVGRHQRQARLAGLRHAIAR